MFLAVAIGFVALVVAEIYVLVAVAQATSVLLAVVLLLGTSIIGGALVRREGAKAWNRAAVAVQEGRTPGPDVADGALILVGGALLFVPGFITDALGLLLVLTPTRRLFRGALGFVLIRRAARRFGAPARRSWGRGRHETVIDGEVVEPNQRPADRFSIEPGDEGDEGR